MNVAVFPERVTRALGIDAYLEHLLSPGLVAPARVLVLSGLFMWLLVVLSFVSSLHLRYVLRQAGAAEAKEKLVEGGRQLRRVVRRVRWVSRALLLAGILLALGSWLSGASRPFESLAFIVLVDVGLMQPCWLITELYGRAFAEQPRATSSSGTR